MCLYNRKSSQSFPFFIIVFRYINIHIFVDSNKLLCFTKWSLKCRDLRRFFIIFDSQFFMMKRSKKAKKKGCERRNSTIVGYCSLMMYIISQDWETMDMRHMLLLFLTCLLTNNGNGKNGIERYRSCLLNWELPAFQFQ